MNYIRHIKMVIIISYKHIDLLTGYLFIVLNKSNMLLYMFIDSLVSILKLIKDS